VASFTSNSEANALPFLEIDRGKLHLLRGISEESKEMCDHWESIQQDECATNAVKWKDLTVFGGG
jgi:hypothetical protein